MKYTIENEYLKLTVETFGAQIASVIRKSDGVEHMWQADPSVWGYHSPSSSPTRARWWITSSKPRVEDMSPPSTALPG